ncbi:MAG TPA: hypothetical protein VFG89_09555 [Coriobacteriia bacterium]|nr:hypothetical protein [Coriobacteriia bacterium]
MMGRGFGYGYHMFGGPGYLGGFMMLALFVCLVVGVVLLIVFLARGSHGHGMHHAGQVPPVGPVPPVPPTQVGHDEAVAIAKRRLASGEITADQYTEIIKTLEG